MTVILPLGARGHSGSWYRYGASSRSSRGRGKSHFVIDCRCSFCHAQTTPSGGQRAGAGTAGESWLPAQYEAVGMEDMAISDGCRSSQNGV